LPRAGVAPGGVTAPDAIVAPVATREPPVVRAVLAPLRVQPPVALSVSPTVASPFPNGEPVTVRDSVFTTQTGPAIPAASASNAPAATSTPPVQPGSTRLGSDGQVQTLRGRRSLPLGRGD